MIDTILSRTNCIAQNPANETLQSYVHALLARQQALDLLETIHQQINQVWASVRRLLVSAGSTARAAQAVRVARASQAAQVQNTYRSLEKRREECIASLQQAERNAHAALHCMMATPRPAVKHRSDSRPLRRTLKSAITARA